MTISKNIIIIAILYFIISQIHVTGVVAHSPRRRGVSNQYYMSYIEAYSAVVVLSETPVGPPSTARNTNSNNNIILFSFSDLATDRSPSLVSCDA